MAVSSLVSTPTVPSETFTVEDFIACRSADNMTYYNLSILARSVTDDGIIYSKDNVIYTYLDILKAKTKKIILTNDEYAKYRFRPKLFAYDIYGATELFFVTMAVNGICDIKDFDLKTLYALTASDLNNLLKQIYSAEIDYIEYNRDQINEKSYVV